MLVLLLLLSEGEWWAVPAWLILSLAVGPGSGVELLCPPRRSAWASLGTEELLEEMLHLWLVSWCSESQRFYCLFFLLCSVLPVNALLWQAGMFRKNIWSCWVRRKPYQQLIWMGITVVDGRSRLWYVMSNSCLSSTVFSECVLTIFLMENLGVVLSFLLVISQFS